MHCARPPVTATTVRQLRRIIVALVAMTGRVTRLGIARWAGPGGSYRTSQRFVATVIPWGLLLWVFFRHSMACPGDVSLVAGDDVSVSKAGTCTHGLDRFLARLSGQPVPGLAFCTLSLVRVQARHAFPRRVEPGVRSDAEQAACKTQAATKPPKAPCATRRPGRPKGRKHTPNAAGDRPAGVRAYCRRARRLAAPDRRGDPMDLRGARRALRPPPRPPEGAAEPSAPACHAAGRCGVVLPLCRALCRARPPSPVGRQGG